MNDFDESVDETVSVSDADVSYTLPDIKQWRVSRFYDYENMIVDYDNMEKLNTAINAARISLFELTDRINSYERMEKRAKTEYERQWRRSYLKSNERTESAKKIQADLLCEELENTVIVYEQVRGEMNRLSNSIRLELQTLQTVANNLRQQMKME